MISARPASECFPVKTAARIFASALAIRWIYALTLYHFMANDGLMGLDSTTYVANAEAFAQSIQAGTVSGTHWLGSFAYTMPLYQWLTTLPFLIFGNNGAIAYVLIQGAFDSGTCVLVFAIAKSIDTRIAFWSSVAAVFNPTQIVLSALIYNDTVFTFFVALTFYGISRWRSKVSWPNALLIGCALGGAVSIRISIVPWAIGAVGLLGILALGETLRKSDVVKLICVAAIFCAALSVIAVRNVSQYGTYSLTPQGGDYLAFYVFPLAKEAQDRTPFAVSLEAMMRRTAERFGPPAKNPFEQSARYQEIGREALHSEIQFSSLVKSWAFGILINLTSPAHLLSPPVAHLPREGFYGTAGNSFTEKVFNFVFSSGNKTYSWLLIVGAAGLFCFRVIQCFGVYALLRNRIDLVIILLAASWLVYLLLLNGPIASPKYRLPLEPLFDIMTGAGLMTIANRWRLHKSGGPQLRTGLTA